MFWDEPYDSEEDYHDYYDYDVDDADSDYENYASDDPYDLRPVCAGFDSSYSDMDMQEDTREETPRVSSLLDLAAISIARHYDCEQLEQSRQPLDEALLKKVAFHAFPKDVRQVRAHALMADTGNHYWNRAQTLLRQGRINMTQVGFSVTAQFTNHSAGNGPCVSLTFEKQCLLSSKCSQCSHTPWCEHVIAACLFHIEKPDKVKLYAPLTDSLSLLSRSQLQKLLQYAANEDSSFMLSIFKHFDTVRDGNSDVNSVEGAPDPTFGDSCLETNFQRSLERMKGRIERRLESLLGPRVPGLGERACQDDHHKYDDTQVKLEINEFPMQVIEFYQLGYPENALSILKVLLETAINMFHCAGSGMLCSLSNKLHRFLVKFVTELALHPSLPTKHRHKIISMVEELVASPAAAKQPILQQDHPKWTSFPTLMTVFGHRLPDLRNRLLGEILCVKEISESPDGLQDLLDGKISIDASTYQEDVCVMLVRLHSMQTIELGDYKEEHQSRLARIILRHLAAAGIQKSVIGKLLAKRGCDVRILCDTIVRSGLSNFLIEVSKEVPPESKERKCDESGEEMVTGDDSGGMTKVEFAFSMMEMCEFLSKAHIMKWLTSNDKHDLVGYCLLALEANRFRLKAGETASRTQQRKLVNLEQHLQEYVLGKISISRSIIKLYFDALGEMGMPVFEPAYPLVLVATLVYMAAREEQIKTQRRQDILRLCTSIIAICDMGTIAKLSPTHADGFYQVEGIVTDLPINSMGHDISSSCSHKTYAWHQVTVLSNTFLELVNIEDSQERKWVSQVVNHLASGVTSYSAEAIAVGLWSFIRRNEDIPLGLAEQILRVLLKCGSQHGTMFSNNPLFNHHIKNSPNHHNSVCASLINKLGCSSLRHLVGNWRVNILPSVMGSHLLQLMEEMQDGHPQSAEFVSLIHQYLSVKHQSNRETVSHAAQLMKFFKYGDDNYTKAVTVISKNASSFPENILFDIACQNIKKKIELKVHRGANKNETVSKEILLILEAYVKKVKDIPPKKLNWLCKLFCETTDNILRFAAMLEGCSNPEILANVMMYFEKMEDKSEAHKSRIQAMLKLSKTYFTLQLKQVRDADNSSFAAEVTRVRSSIQKLGDDRDVKAFDFIIRSLKGSIRREDVMRAALMRQVHPF